MRRSKSPVSSGTAFNPIGRDSDRILFISQFERAVAKTAAADMSAEFHPTARGPQRRG